VLEELYKQRDGTTGRATDLLEKYVKEHPDTEGVREAKLRLGYFYDEQGNYDAAVALGEKFLEEHSDRTAECARAQLRIAYAYEHSGRYEEARVAFEKVIQHYADQPQSVAIAKGDLAFAVLACEGKLHEAIALTKEAMEALVSSDPVYITFQYRLGTFYEQLGEYQEALQQYTQVPEGRASDPHLDRNIGVMLGKARCLWALQEYEKAQAVLEQIMEKWPQEALKRGVADALEEVRVTAERATKQ
jgi:tetratricopeptide (TPR) repeat protein